MNRTWINDFVGKISNIEGHFEVYTSVFLKYENQFVFGLKDSKNWLYENNKRKASLSAFGGKLEEGIEINQFLKKYCTQELGINIEIIDSPHTYIDYHNRLKKLPIIDSAKGELRPQLITIVHGRHSTKPNTIIFSYLGHTKYKPHSIKYSALLLAREQVLVQMFKNEKTVSELKKLGAIFEERIKIPDNLYLYPTGSLNSLLRYLSYEVF
ncbi:MAG: hypothetical protein ACOC6D_05915 [Atribacterota bacterium]